MAGQQIVGLDDETVLVVGLPRAGFDLLVEDHPPRDGKAEPWNDDTFPPALIALCTRSSLDEARRRWDDAEVDSAEQLLEVCVRMSAPGSWAWATRRLLRDPRLRMEMRFCNGAGLSHDTFLGWSDRAQDLALAAYLLGIDCCPGCGVRTELMQDVEAADIEQMPCVHCEQRNQVTASMPADARDRIHVVVVPREG